MLFCFNIYKEIYTLLLANSHYIKHYVSVCFGSWVEDVSYKSTEFMSQCKLLVLRKSFIQQINILSKLGFCFPLIFTELLTEQCLFQFYLISYRTSCVLLSVREGIRPDPILHHLKWIYSAQ